MDSTESKFSSNEAKLSIQCSFHDFAEQGEQIGRGGFGAVYKVLCRSCSTYFARKDIKIDVSGQDRDEEREVLKRRLRYMQDELHVLKTLQHPYIIYYVQSSIKPVTESISILNIFTKFCEYKDVLYEMDHGGKWPFPESFVWNICHALFSALAKCHHGLRCVASNSSGVTYRGFDPEWKPIIHRDIKPNNMFLSKGPLQEGLSLPDVEGCGGEIDYGSVVPKLGDFGTVCLREEADRSQTAPVGTLAFMAPEILDNAPPSEQSDIWSAGATIYYILTSRFPIQNFSSLALLDRITTLRSHLPPNSETSQVLQRLVCECLAPKPEDRPTAIDMLAVCIKAEDPKESSLESETFWKSLAAQAGGVQSSLVANVTRRFVSGYLNILNTRYSAKEICLLMALQYLFYKPRMKYSAQKLIESAMDCSSIPSVFHAAAIATSQSQSIRNFTWDGTGWPNEISIGSMSLKRDDQGLLPSLVAAVYGNAKVAKALLEIEMKARAEVDKLKALRLLEEQRSVFESHGRKELEFMYIILTNNGKQPPKLDEQFKTGAFSAAAAEGYENVLEKLLDLGANLKGTTGSRRESALHCAAAKGQTRIVSLLLEKGIPVDVADNGHRMPLHCAARKGNVKVAQLLLDHKAPINARDDNNMTALYMAADAGHKGMVSLLLEYGADRSLPGGIVMADVPLKRAQKSGYEDVAELLDSFGGSKLQMNTPGLIGRN